MDQGHVDKGLKPDAVGFWDALIVGISSTAPAYSLAAVIGTIVVGACRRRACCSRPSSRCF